ncbi:hypothetical protein [Pseudomonas plecoglossicida]|uniref:hypothetical protein n=1 Tax=Pseudomonas plecoglossicida TaxID=70775 RepID=UPI003D238DB7
MATREPNEAQVADGDDYRMVRRKLTAMVFNDFGLFYCDSAMELHCQSSIMQAVP